ncbi:hypothetical protein [Nocardioides perillae]|uniref:Transcriptional regulator, AbiEi antitoxin, Type IV TA system n=1 Tax=Nocardioides perillae TaxID=1119534 RepID=A0A7Y9RX64_9ACTN|nr:hypothetical protein [Nocardioides perillae]NYG56312.1 hypothetical protein [Nocardioides perillae]
MTNVHRTARDLDQLAERCPTTAPFSSTHALRLGLAPEDLSDLVRTARLKRVLIGVYVRTHVADSLALRAAALRLVVPDGSFVTDRSAAWLHGASMALAPGDHLEVPPLDVFRIPSATRLRNPIVVSGRRTVAADELCTVAGLVVTTPLRTALDLGRLQRPDIALAGMDGLARLQAFTVAELVDAAARIRGARGVVQLRRLAPLVDPGAESPGESALRLRWLEAGLPRPQCQVLVQCADGHTYYLDIGLADVRFGAEYDGADWHGPDRAAHDTRRRQCITKRAGWHLEVFRAEHVHGRDQDAHYRLLRAWTEHAARRRRVVV